MSSFRDPTKNHVRDLKNLHFFENIVVSCQTADTNIHKVLGWTGKHDGYQVRILKNYHSEKLEKRLGGAKIATQFGASEKISGESDSKQHL